MKLCMSGLANEPVRNMLMRFVVVAGITGMIVVSNLAISWSRCVIIRDKSVGLACTSRNQN
jgi:hypothetical protein